MSTYQVLGVQKINDTIAHWLAWTQTFGQALSGFGWVKQSGHGELVDNGSTGAAYAWANVGSVITLPTTALAIQQNYRFNGAWVSGNTYTGGNAANGATTTDLVTFTTGGNTNITFVHITATSALTTAPPSDTTNWQPFMYEIWKSNGGQSSSHPIYLRIVYTTAAATNGQPAIHFAIGTGVDANGNLTGAIKTSSNSPATNALVFSATTGSASLSNLNFSGDADNFRFAVWQGNNGINNGNNCWIVVIDRAKTATGGDSDAFAYVGWMYPLGGTAANGNGILLKPSLGAPINQQNNGTNSCWVGVVGNGNLSATSLSSFGNVPPFPIFPLVGYVANPLLGVVGLNSQDTVDGQVYPVWLYGSSHNFLAIATDPNAGKFNLGGLSGTVVPAIRWE